MESDPRSLRFVEPAASCFSARGIGKGPTPALTRLFGHLGDRDGLIATCQRAGFRVRSAESSTQAEWDAFESAWSDVDNRKRDYEEGIAPSSASRG